MKRLLLILVFLSFCWASIAQDFDEWRRQQQQEWSKCKDVQQQKWADFREKLNKEYAEKMGRQWSSCKVSPAIPVPSRPEPPTPVIKKNAAPAPTCAVTVKEYVKPTVCEQPQPFQPIARPINEPAAAYTFNFHQTPCKVHVNEGMAFALPNVSENTVSAAWQRLSSSGYDLVADDCLNYREQLELNDWGYIELTKTLAGDFLGQNTNESVLMQAYLLVQSGYKVRLARSEGRLVLMMPFATDIYKYAYLLLDGEKFYLLDNDEEGSSYYVFNENFKGEKTASLELRKEPRFFDTPTLPKTFVSSYNPETTTNISTNQNLIDFYNSCPVTSNWRDYAKASLSKKIKWELYPVLKKQIAGKTEEEAANILLNFVQTAFAYKTDQEQFGYERPLFGDEMFYYPYSDCEDRSILFTILIHDLLHLDVVMLEYPGHLATAVRFSQDVAGYYVMMNEAKYVVCDPTYIGASVGECMPQFQNTAAATIVVYE